MQQANLLHMLLLRTLMTLSRSTSWISGSSYKVLMLMIIIHHNLPQASLPHDAICLHTTMPAGQQRLDSRDGHSSSDDEEEQDEEHCDPASCSAEEEEEEEEDEEDAAAAAAPGPGSTAAARVRSHAAAAPGPGSSNAAAAAKPSKQKAGSSKKRAAAVAFQDAISLLPSDLDVETLVRTRQQLQPRNRMQKQALLQSYKQQYQHWRFLLRCGVLTEAFVLRWA